MRNRVGLILALAVVSGALAAYLAWAFLREPAGTVAEASEVRAVSVAVAARDMDVGHVLAAEDIELVSWPAAAVPRGYSGDPSEVVGRGLLTPVKANEPLLSGKLARSEAGGGLPIIIPEGKRALSVRVDEVIGVAGFTVPGTRVDVLLTLDQTAATNEPATQVVLQNIEVLTAGQAIERDTRGEPHAVPVVTLLVDPEQAEKLALSATRGRIQLALRNTLDLEEVETSGARLTQLIMMARPAATTTGPTRRVNPPRPRGVQVDVYRGPQRETSTVEDRQQEGGGS